MVLVAAVMFRRRAALGRRRWGGMGLWWWRRRGVGGRSGRGMSGLSLARCRLTFAWGRVARDETSSPDPIDDTTRNVAPTVDWRATIAARVRDNHGPVAE